MTWAQMKQYRAMVAKAVRELGLVPGTQAENYRLEVLFEETGKRSSLDVNTQTEYEALMRRHAADANDWGTAAHYCAGNAKRMAAMASDCARQVLELSGKEGETEGALYILAILRAGNFVVKDVTPNPADWWKDCPEGTIKQIFCILDKHRRRMVARERRISASGVASDTPLRFRYGATWARK